MRKLQVQILRGHFIFFQNQCIVYLTAMFKNIPPMCLTFFTGYFVFHRDIAIQNLLTDTFKQILVRK